MDNQVEEIKRKVNIVDIVSVHVNLKRKGRNLVGLCPFHSEKSGSFMVNDELQIYKCFGCGAGGDVIKFLMDVEGLEFPEALEKLADKVGVKLVERKKDQTSSSKGLMIEVHNLAMEYFHYLLNSHASGEIARKYLENRGVSKKLIETFRIGYSLPEWDGLVRYLVDKKGYKPEILVAAGLAVGSNGRLFDRFRGRVMFPLFDISGRVVGFSGRILPELAKDDDAKYINSPETEIYHKSKMLFGLTVARGEIRKKNRVVVVEGELDMISSYAAGVTETVAIKGSALTEEMMDVISRLTTNIILSLDADDAGEAAMKRSLESAEKRGLSIKMVELSGGKDPDEIARKKPREWAESVDKSVSVYEFFFNRSIEKWKTESVEGITKIVNEVVPYLAKIENSVIREVWAKKLSEKLGVDKQRVYEEIEKKRTGKVSYVERQKPVFANSDGRTSLDLQIVGGLMQAKKDELTKIKKLLVGLPLTGGVGKIVGLIFESGGIDNTHDFISKLPAELTDIASEAYMKSEETDERGLVKLVVAWAKNVIREERSGLSVVLKEAERSQNEAEMGNLSEKLVKLNALERKLAQV